MVGRRRKIDEGKWLSQGRGEISHEEIWKRKQTLVIVLEKMGHLLSDIKI